MATPNLPLVGAEAPQIEALDQDGSAVRLSDLRGRWVVIYFYPRDDTPGCTREACSFRDHHSALASEGAVVLGVSGDSQASHRRFIEKHDLPFTLLVDSDRTIARAYGAWGLKKQYGREYEGVIRSTVVVDPGGRVACVWPRVKPGEHGREVLDWLTKRRAGGGP